MTRNNSDFVYNTNKTMFIKHSYGNHSLQKINIMMIYYPLPFPNSDLYHLYHYGEYHENFILSPWFRTFVLFTPPFFGGLQRRLPSPQRDFAVAQGQTRRTHLVWGLGTTRRRGSAEVTASRLFGIMVFWEMIPKWPQVSGEWIMIICLDDSMVMLVVFWWIMIDHGSMKK
jgi:hypothetical protein